MGSSLVARVARRLALVAAMAATAVVLVFSGTDSVALLDVRVSGPSATHVIP